MAVRVIVGMAVAVIMMMVMIVRIVMVVALMMMVVIVIMMVVHMIVTVAMIVLARLAGADALHVMMMAFLDAPDLGLVADRLFAVLAHLAVHGVAAVEDLAHPLG